MVGGMVGMVGGMVGGMVWLGGVTQDGWVGVVV